MFIGIQQAHFSYHIFPHIIQKTIKLHVLSLQFVNDTVCNFHDLMKIEVWIAVAHLTIHLFSHTSNRPFR